MFQLFLPWSSAEPLFPLINGEFQQSGRARAALDRGALAAETLDLESDREKLKPLHPHSGSRYAPAVDLNTTTQTPPAAPSGPASRDDTC